MQNTELIKLAANVVNSRKYNDFYTGDVGCALITLNGNIFTGVCIDVASSMGFCAEHNAIGSMITAGEFRIAKIVAAWKERDDVYVLSPCGRCRQFMFNINNDNLDTEVVLDVDRTVRLRELLPYHDWWHKTKL